MPRICLHLWPCAGAQQLARPRARAQLRPRPCAMAPFTPLSLRQSSALPLPSHQGSATAPPLCQGSAMPRLCAKICQCPRPCAKDKSLRTFTFSHKVQHAGPPNNMAWLTFKEEALSIPKPLSGLGLQRSRPPHSDCYATSPLAATYGRTLGDRPQVYTRRLRPERRQYQPDYGWENNYLSSLSFV